MGVAYSWLEYRAGICLWIAGIVMPAIYIFVYYEAGFYADFGINVYYLLAGLYGWAVWKGMRPLGFGKRGEPAREDKSGLPITHTPASRILPLTVICLVIFVAIAWVLIRFTDSTVPYGDSLTTALSVVGMWMLARKYIEQWLVWIAVDVICCALYVYKGLYPTAVLYGLYSVIAVFGYFKWLRMMKTQKIAHE